MPLSAVVRKAFATCYKIESGSIISAVIRQRVLFPFVLQRRLGSPHHVVGKLVTKIGPAGMLDGLKKARCNKFRICRMSKDVSFKVLGNPVGFDVLASSLDEVKVRNAKSPLPLA